jgi:hypothetical protein
MYLNTLLLCLNTWMRQFPGGLKGAYEANCWSLTVKAVCKKNTALIRSLDAGGLKSHSSIVPSMMHPHMSRPTAKGPELIA